MILSKMSSPGWDKEFKTENQLKTELYKYICGSCIEEFTLSHRSSVMDMLASPCGCEFWVEGLDEQ